MYYESAHLGCIYLTNPGAPHSTMLLPVVGSHILGGLICIVSGIGAMLSEKRRGRHVSFGSIYYWFLGWVCASGTFLGALHWSQDYYLVLLAILSIGSASIGRMAHRRHWQGWAYTHVVGMSLSYVAMLTAFSVEDGENLLLGRDIPHILYWFLPSLIAVPLVTRALMRNRKRHYAGDNLHQYQVD